METTLKTE